MAEHSPIVMRVRRFLSKARRLAPPLVVAVSGGPDSVALLRALVQIGPGPLVVAHLNHCMRGAESDADELFVRDLAAELSSSRQPINFRTARREMDAMRNIESAARNVRYAWLTSVALEVGAHSVLSGHTADDQAETVLFQLIRGTGFSGLAGIAPRRPLSHGVELLRPMLTVRRADVMQYLESLQQPFREDATNLDLRRTRNRIRHVLLPQLAEQYNPRVVDALGRLAVQARAWQNDQVVEAQALLEQAEKPRAGSTLVFDRMILANAPRHWRRALWRQVWEREHWPRGDMGFREWDRLAGLCRGGPSAIDLPDGVRARRLGDIIQLSVIPLGA